MKCKEKIFEIRVHESRNRVARLLERASLVCEFPPPPSHEIPS
jgi:hypothetical protein